MAGFNVESRELILTENIFIEASAGTGKTHTIKTIILRLLIEKKLKMDQILVVTFTRLATLELKKRIREALRNTYLLVESRQSLPEYLIHHVETEEDRISVLSTIKGALALLEQAKIMTIHGFSAYLISRYRNFDDTFSENSVASLPQLRSIMKDFLRTELPTTEVAVWQQELLLGYFRGDFEALINELGRFAVRRVPIECGLSYTHHFATIQKKMFSLRENDLAAQCVSQAPFYKDLCTKSKEIKKEAREEFERLARIVNGSEDLPQFKELFKLLPENLKKGVNVQPLYTDILLELQELNDPLHIFAAVAERARLYLMKVVEKEGVLFYEDLLLGASRLVDKEEVRKGIEEECKIALIDEFQDTDALQWHIFSTLFLPRNALIVVGDPKQSIYRFRLADLYTYMEAKESFSQRLTLTKNYRSQACLVEGLNDLFAPIKDFLVLPERNESFPCPKVESHHGEGGLLHFWAVESEEQLFALVAKELLSLQEQGIPLSDCAILVKDRHQMQRLRSAFESFGAPLETIREGPITKSAAFPLLIEFIEALLDPGNLSKQGKVLLSPLFDFSIEEIEENQEVFLPEFFKWSVCLQERGLLVAVRELMEAQGEVLFSQEIGARVYSDLMQLVELSIEKDISPEELISFYTKLSEEGEEQEKLKPRSLVSQEAPLAMTIHMSKGLEFEVVFPVGLIATFAMKRDLIYVSSKRCYLPGEGIEELHAEKMRLLYVALTRAKSHLYVPYLEGERPLTGKSSCMDLLMSKRPLTATSSFVGKKVLPPSFPKISNREYRNKSLPSYPSTQSFEIHSFSSIFSHKPREKEILMPPSFPLGSKVGTLLHLVLEKISFTIESKQMLMREVSNILRGTVLAEYIDPVVEMIFQVIHLPLQSDFGSFSLSSLNQKKMYKEALFIKIQDVEGSKGVIDLFFEHKGRYYFIDWKSNYLAAYDQNSMKEEMDACAYYEQARMYTEALAHYIALFDHRSFDQLFGGFFYIFLRGPGVIYGK